jgi:DNA-binding winged helix-turn-helix (wHTH) protein
MRYRFDEHVVDVATRELLRAGEPVHVSPKGFELLRLLLEHRPKALAKPELMQRLWPDTHVQEANLTNLVVEVRAALGDDPRRPRYIRTLHRYGYAFRGTVEPARPDGQPGGATWRVVWRGGEAALAEGDHVVGRDSDCSVCLDFPTVSRRHARIRIASDGITIEDLDSKNGTRLNGQPVAAGAALADGDEIRVGSVRLRLRLARHPASTETGTSAE